MYLEAKIKKKTPLLSKFDGLGKPLGTLQPNQKIALVSLHKYGMESYYRMPQGGYVNGSDVSITRDVEFTDSNGVDGNGLGNSSFRAAVDSTGYRRYLAGYKPTPITQPTNTTNIDTSGYRRNLEKAYKGPYYTKEKGMVERKPGFKEQAIDKLKGVGFTDVFRSNNSTYNQLLSGATFGSIADGSFFQKAFRKNIRNILYNLISSRLRYVIGFDFSAELGRIFDILAPTYPDFHNFGNGGRPENNGSLMYRGITYEDQYTGKIVNGQYMQRQIHYAEVDEAAIRYFKYQGCDGRTIIKRFGDMYEWEQDESYATPLVTDPPIIDKDEVRIYKDMHDDLYDDTRDIMSAIYDAFDIHVDRQTIFNKFNRHRLVSPDNELLGTRGHVFITQPNMNLNFNNPKNGGNVLSRSATVMHASAAPLMFNMLKSHAVLMQYLMGGGGQGHPFIPIMTDRLTSLDVADEVLETAEHGETLTGWKNTYAMSTIKSRTAGSVNLTFRDDDMLSVYKLIKVWVEYMNAVYRGEAYPNMTLAEKHILDYAVSIYYFLTKTDGEEILYWCKFTGCFPTAVPTSNFSDSSTESVSPTYTVPFQYAKKDDFNPLSIVEFNHLSKSIPFTAIPTYNPNTYHGTKSFVGCPFVDTQTAGRLYRLKFRA